MHRKEERITESYIILPQRYTVIRCTGRKEEQQIHILYYHSDVPLAEAREEWEKNRVIHFTTVIYLEAYIHEGIENKRCIKLA